MSAKFIEQTTADGKITSVDFNPRYFFAYEDCESYINEVGGKKCFVINCDDEFYDFNAIGKHYKVTQSDTNQLTLPIELYPLTHNSKHNMLQLDLDNEFIVHLGSADPFGVDKITFSHRFVNHLSVIEKNNGDTQINIIKVHVIFSAKSQCFELKNTHDYSLTYNKDTGEISVTDNKIPTVNPQETLGNFLSVISTSFLTQSDYETSSDYHVFHVFKGLISKHLLNSDYPFAISKIDLVYGQRLKDNFMKNKRTPQHQTSH